MRCPKRVTEIIAGDPYVQEEIRHSACRLRGRDAAGLRGRQADHHIELALRIGSQECADILKKARADQVVREQAVRTPQAKQD